MDLCQPGFINPDMGDSVRSRSARIRASVSAWQKVVNYSLRPYAGHRGNQAYTSFLEACVRGIFLCNSEQARTNAHGSKGKPSPLKAADTTRRLPSGCIFALPIRRTIGCRESRFATPSAGDTGSRWAAGGATLTPAADNSLRAAGGGALTLPPPTAAYVPSE